MLETTPLAILQLRSDSPHRRHLKATTAAPSAAETPIRSGSSESDSYSEPMQPICPTEKKMRQRCTGLICAIN